MHRARGRFIKYVEGLLHAEAVSRGFKRRKGIHVRPLSDIALGTLGFNRATHRSEDVYVAPYVGVIREDVSKLRAKLQEGMERTSQNVLVISLGYLMPERTYREWVFSEGGDSSHVIRYGMSEGPNHHEPVFSDGGGNEALARDALEAYMKYGLPWQMEHSSLEAISRSIQAGIASPGNPTFIEPLIWFLLGDRDKARDYVVAELAKLEGEDHVLATSYIPFGKAFLEMLESKESAVEETRQEI